MDRHEWVCRATGLPVVKMYMHSKAADCQEGTGEGRQPRSGAMWRGVAGLLWDRNLSRVLLVAGVEWLDAHELRVARIGPCKPCRRWLLGISEWSRVSPSGNLIRPAAACLNGWRAMSLLLPEKTRAGSSHDAQRNALSAFSVYDGAAYAISAVGCGVCIW